MGSYVRPGVDDFQPSVFYHRRYPDDYTDSVKQFLRKTYAAGVLAGINSADMIYLMSPILLGGEDMFFASFISLFTSSVIL